MIEEQPGLEEELPEEKEEVMTSSLKERIFRRIYRMREKRRIQDEKCRAYQRCLINLYEDIFKDTKVRTEKDVHKLNDYFKEKLGSFDPLALRMNAIISDEIRHKDQKASELIEEKIKNKVVEKPTGPTWQDIKDRYKIGLTQQEMPLKLKVVTLCNENKPFMQNKT